MKRDSFAEPASTADHEAIPTEGHAAALCRAVLMFDQSVDKHIRAERLSRIDLDMLFDLYVAEHDGCFRCLWDVCQAVPAPFSTAYRRLCSMIDRGLVVRAAPDGDWRRVIIYCSADAKMLLAALTARLDARWACLARIHDHDHDHDHDDVSRIGSTTPPSSC